MKVLDVPIFMDNIIVIRALLSRNANISHKTIIKSWIKKQTLSKESTTHPRLYNKRNHLDKEVVPARLFNLTKSN